MHLWDVRSSLVILVIVAGCLILCNGQQRYNPYGQQQYNRTVHNVTWCTVSEEEQTKCNNFMMATERDAIKVGYDEFKMNCYQAFNKDECMQLLDAEKVTFSSLDAGEVFVGGRYHSLVPISQEISEGGFHFNYAVAVVKKGGIADVHSLRDLKGKHGCFAGVGTLAGWTLPVHTLMKEGGMDIVDCNNHVKSATAFFGPSCAVNALSDKYNPIGDNSDLLCSLCIGKIPGGKCTDTDPYAGFTGAFRCLLEAGDIAFLKHYTVTELLNGAEFSSVPKDGFELFCKDGTRRAIEDYRSCNWGTVPTNAIVTSSATTPELRRKYQKFLEKVARFYGPKNGTQPAYGGNDEPQYDQFGNRQRQKRQNYGNYGQGGQNYDYNRNRNQDQYNADRREQFARDPFAREPFENRDIYDHDNRDYARERDEYDEKRHDDEITNRRYNSSGFYEVFNLFESSPKYGIHSNLLVQDNTRSFKALDENVQTYSGYLGASMDIIMGIRNCPVGRMTLCVTSDVELEKCVKMRTALKAQLLKPELVCYKAHSQINCMQAIRSGNADVTVLDASDVYTAGLNFDLVPFISEVYNLGKPEYYVVAVAKESDPDTEITYLKGKNTCHGGINTAAGWVYPLAYLLANGWIRPYGCNSIRAAAEYFSKSCIPGALSSEYNTGVPYDNMCHLCHGSSFRYCRRDASEDYYGHTGALRCLVEGGGHVAFVKHTTVLENTGGKRKEWWARDALMDDFELLCPDGTRAEVNEYDKCNLGKVKANAIVARGGNGYNHTQISAFINLFMYSQTFYGRKIPDEFSFSMFYSIPPYTDLIFQDATTQLLVIPPEQRHYAEYLGKDFMRARRLVDCHAGAANTRNSLVVLTMSSLFAILVL